jgi:small GTP-binding protein
LPLLRVKSKRTFRKEMDSQGGDYVEISLKTPRDAHASQFSSPPVMTKVGVSEPKSVLPPKETKLFKVLVIGDPNVGKSSFIKRHVHGMFSSTRKPTVGLDFHECTFHWDVNTEVRLHFWDVPGQERLHSQTGIFYRDTRAMLVVYDADNNMTMSQARKWKQDADSKCTLNGHPYKPPAILLANKIDLVCTKSENFDTYALDILVREEGFRCGFPISALGNYNIAQAVRKLVELLLEEDKILRGTGLLNDPEDDTTIDLAEVFEPRTEKKKCEC